MAGGVVEDPGGDGVEIEFQSPVAMHLPEIGGGVARRLDDTLEVVVLDEEGIVVHDRRHRRRFGAYDPVAESDRLGQDPHVGGRQFPRRRQIPGGDQRHAG